MTSFVSFCALLLIATTTFAVSAQQMQGSPLHEEEILPHPPSSWREKHPSQNDYKATLFINPCGSNGTHANVGGNALGFDCCVNHFGGSGEYGIIDAYQEYGPDHGQRFLNGLRVSPWHYLAGPDEVSQNVDLVDEEWNPIEQSRRVEDETTIDDACVGYRNPFSYCKDNRLRLLKSKRMAPCTDNNATVDATLECHDVHGRKAPNCMQVGVSQTSLIHQCGGDYAKDRQCGSFVEIHRPNGSPYDDEMTILGESRIDTRLTNGMVTVTLSLTYKADPKKILCNYHETKIRVGSMVRITVDAPACCCPPKYRNSTAEGSFLCPRRPDSRDGPFATKPTTLYEQLEIERFGSEYPFCANLSSENDSEDALMCSKRSSSTYSDHGAYTYRCRELALGQNGSFSSPDLNGQYDAQCPIGGFAQSCALALRDINGNNRCSGNDRIMTFQEEIGKVMQIPEVDEANPRSKGKYFVSFNDGRSSYPFYEHELDLVQIDNSLEVWFVQRHAFENIVTAKKAFRVMWPQCSFDSVNDRYFPYRYASES